MPLQSSSSDNGGIDPVEVIGRPHHDNAFSASQAVQLLQEGIDDLVE